MISRKLFASIVTSMLLLYFPVSKAWGQSFSVERTVKKHAWFSGNHILIEESSFSLGDVLTRGRTVTKHPADCFAGLQTNHYSYSVAEEPYLVWKAGLITRLMAFVQGIKIRVSVPATEGKPGPVEPDVEVILKTTSELADNVTAFVSFRGRREEVNPNVLNDYAKDSHWSQQCLATLRSPDSYVIAEIIQGFVRIRFAEQSHDKFNAIDFAMPSWWKRVDKGEFEKAATLIVAGHPKLKTKGSTITGMEFTSYLKDLESR
jgi:hypothetical protein